MAAASTSPRFAAAAALLFLLLLAAGSLHCAAARHYAPPSICLQPPPRSEGLCTIEIEGFYFDQRTNDCHMYTVGGCRSSRGQSFGTRENCISTCIRGTRRIQDLYVNE